MAEHHRMDSLSGIAGKPLLAGLQELLRRRW